MIAGAGDPESFANKRECDSPWLVCSPTRSPSALPGWLGNMLIDKDRIAVGIG